MERQEKALKSVANPAPGAAKAPGVLDCVDSAVSINSLPVISTLHRKDETQGDVAVDHAAMQKLNRSAGLKLFDVALYPLLNNFVVFGISVGATYLTSKGGDRNAQGKLVYGKVGEFFFKRGQWLVNKFEKMGMSPAQADMSKMVFFSFADGTLIAPAIKLLEDRRERVAYAIDTALGTVPQDRSVYDAEPKQSWFSVIGGRLATCSVVVPTAVAMDRLGLNDKFFNEPSKRIGKYIAGKPDIAKMFGKLDPQEVARVGVFEGFYTSVCTAGLYFISRFIACNLGKDEEEKRAPVIAHSALPQPYAAATAMPAYPPLHAAPGMSYAQRVTRQTDWKQALIAGPTTHHTDLAQHSQVLERV